MKYNSLEINAFMELADQASSIVIDVRSEGEFEQGHIPEAVNIPLLNNAQRHQVGICYKERGQQAAIDLGFELVGPFFAEKIANARSIVGEKHIAIYCWRGGLRSNIMAWLFSTAGMKVTLLQKGYKAFRNANHARFSSFQNYLVLGGKTGSGKSEILHLLARHGHPIVDLESIAHHKGSAFGALGQEVQFTQEHFENHLGNALRLLPNDCSVWIEDESRFVGKNKIPDAMYEHMQQSPKVFLDRSKEERIARILNEYGQFDPEILAEKTASVAKRMGPEQSQQAIAFLGEGLMQQWAGMLLDYYDKTYEHAREIKARSYKNIVDHIHVSSSLDEQHIVDVLVRFATTCQQQTL
jgi:tRNA 2-selenouridine synthase